MPNIHFGKCQFWKISFRGNVISKSNTYNKTRANTHQVLPVQTGLYRYDELMMQNINDKNLNES